MVCEAVSRPFVSPPKKRGWTLDALTAGADYRTSRIRMPPLSEMARHLSVSKSRAGQLKDLGIPVHYFEAARKWRASQPIKRGPTNAQAAKLQSAKTGRPKAPKKLSKTGDALAGILKNTIATAEAAFESYHADAVAGEPSQAVLLANHSRAAEAVAKIERMVREEMERRDILVSKSVITDACRRAMDAMLRRLRRLPDETGPQCEGHEAIKIVKIPQNPVNEIMLAGRKAMLDL